MRDHGDVVVEVEGEPWNWTQADLTIPLADAGGVRITANHAQRGGGIYARNGAIEATFAIVADNVADLDGGGAFLDNRGTLTATNSLVSSNAASGAGGGAALVGFNARLDLASDFGTCLLDSTNGPWTDHYCSELRENSLTGAGGAGGMGGAIVASNRSTVELQTTAILENEAVTNAAAISLLGAGGGGQRPTANLFSVLVAGNRLTAATGNDSISSLAATLRIAQSTLADVDLQVQSNALSNGSLHGNVFWAGTACGMDALCVAVDWAASGPTKCNLGDGASALGASDDEEGDPGFVTTSRGDYRVAPPSDALDACRKDGPFDLDGIARPQVDPAAPPGAPRFDRGAFEFDYP